jgi:hypothetical protein
MGDRNIASVGFYKYPHIVLYFIAMGKIVVMPLVQGAPRRFQR